MVLCTNWSKTLDGLDICYTPNQRTAWVLQLYSTHSLSACGIPLFLEYPILLANMSNTVSGFQSILDALDEYAKVTGIKLNEKPFADKVSHCGSPDSVLQLLQENVKSFKEYRDEKRKFINCLSPVVQFVHAFSEVLGEAAGLVSQERLGHFISVLSYCSCFHKLPFPPAKLIFVGIDVLFTVCTLLIRRPSESDI